MSKPGVRQINKAEYDREYDAAMTRWETPVSQQTIESHVVVPMLIAIVISIFCAGLTAAFIIMAADVLSNFSEQPLNPLNMWTIALVMFAGALGFLSAFLWRIGVGDSLLMKFEELTGLDINDDGMVGVAPRSVSVNTKNGTRDVALADKPTELYPPDWGQVATAILNKRGNVSWRGIYNNCDISQPKAQAAAKHLKAGYSDGLVLNARGWDWLIAYLPKNTQCLIERPDSPTDTPLPD